MRALFEAVHQDFRNGARFVNAWHAQGAAWAMSGEDEPRARFWGTSIDMHLHWNVALTFADGESFSWRKVRCAHSTVSRLGSQCCKTFATAAPLDCALGALQTWHGLLL